jgi:hypothetical protein
MVKLSEPAQAEFSIPHQMEVQVSLEPLEPLDNGLQHLSAIYRQQETLNQIRTVQRSNQSKQRQ